MPTADLDAWQTVEAGLESVHVFLSEPQGAASVAFVLVSVCVGLILHRRAVAKARVLPYIPSLTELFDAEHDETTRFLASVHDMTMAITDAWNATRARQVKEATVEAVVRTDALLPACEAVIAGAEAVRERFRDHGDLAGLAQSAHHRLGDAWDYTSHDNYRTEVYTVTTTDSDGKTQTETRTRQVYENTDHYFNYSPGAAHDAQDRIADLLEARNDCVLTLPDVARLEMRLTALDPAQRSFLERMVRHTILEEPEAEVDEPEIVNAASQWFLGARVDDWLRAVIDGGDLVEASHAELMATVLASNRRYHYCTTSRSHSGPPGFIAAKDLGFRLYRLVEGWASLSMMLDHCEAAAEELSEWATDRSEEESDREYVKAAARAYEAAFPDSILEIDQLPRHGRTIGIAMAVGGAVAALMYFWLDGHF